MIEKDPYPRHGLGITPEADASDTETLAAQKLSFAPEYFGVSSGVTEEEARQAAAKFETWLEDCMEQRHEEVKTYNAGPRPVHVGVREGKTDKKYPTKRITRGRDFRDGSSLVVALVEREEAISDADDELRGSPVGVEVALFSRPRMPSRSLMYRLGGEPPVLRREEQNEFYTVGGRTIPRMTDEQLAEKTAQGLADQLCGLKELAGLMYLVDDEELPKTGNFLRHEYEDDPKKIFDHEDYQ